MSMEDTMRERRDAEIARQANRKTGLTSPFEVKVVGVSFTPHYPDNLHQLDGLMKPRMVPYPMLQGEMAQEIAEKAYEEHVSKHGYAMAPEPLAVVLVRNPDNNFDANAIEVHIPALGEMGFIGHLTRPIAARMAPEIDAGDEWGAETVSVLIDPDHMDRPGISIKCARAPKEQQ